MANDATRLSTADLRRRLMGPGAPPPPAELSELRAASRPLIPAAMADIPVEEDGSTVPIPDLPMESGAILPEPVPPTAAPVTRLTPTELRRPEGRSASHLARPVLPAAAE